MSTSLRFNTDFSLSKTSHIIEDLCNELLRYTDRVVDVPDRFDIAGNVNHSISYDAAREPIDVKIERQLYAFFQKNASFDLGIDTRQVAYDTFMECERKCGEVNNQLRSPFKNDYHWPVLLDEVRALIAKILGPVPRVDELSCSFGPGNNVGCTRLTSTRRKLQATPTISPTAIKYVPYIQDAYPQWNFLQKSVEVSYVGELSFVPKNAKTDRPICVEPLLSSFIQTGIGRFIKDRLMEEGINLRSQAVNQKLARIGSIDNSFATIDLSSASDTISLMLVRKVLSPEWFDLLYAFRSHSALLPDGTVLPLEKFSSMGNGYTFELESLIFYAITRVICGREATISVYGDDIICPSEKYPEVVNALTCCGFSVNSEKSFAQGPFRESCGRDFFKGVSVRPCYLKGAFSVKELFRFHNYFFREGMHDMCRAVLKYIPRRFRCYGPDGFGDGHLLTTSRLRTVLSETNSNGSLLFYTWTTSPRVMTDRLAADYTAWLYLVTDFVDDDVDPYSLSLARRSLFSLQRKSVTQRQIDRFLGVPSMTPANYSRSIYYERSQNKEDQIYKQIRVLTFE